MEENMKCTACANLKRRKQIGAPKKLELKLSKYVARYGKTLNTI